MNPFNYLLNQAKVIFPLLTTGVLLMCSGERKTSIDYLGQTPPGMTAQLFAPGLVTTDSFEHSAPAFSPDGTVVLWTVVSRSYRGSLQEMKLDKGKWSAPYRPSFADSTADDYYPSFSPDGKKLYFSSRRKVPRGYPEGRDIRIWEVERNQGIWGNPMPVDTTVSQGHEYAHSVAKNGTLYFSSSVGGGMSWSIRKSEKKTNGSYANPVLLPFNINSVDYEDGPYVAPDESFLIFDSQRAEGIQGSIDLYISFKNNKNLWSVPVNMGQKINSPGTERFVKLSPDGKYLFFGSNRNQSDHNWGFDIFWIDARVIDELKKDASAHIIEQPLGEEIANALYRNDNDASAGLLKRWLSSHPNSLDATVVYGSILRKQRHYTEAEQLLTNSPAQWKENINIKMEMALVKFGVNKDNEAVELLAPILVEGNQLRERYLYLSRSLLDMSKLKVSDEYFDKAMTISPSSFPYYNRASALARIGEKDRAFYALNKAVEYGGYNQRNDYEADKDLESLKSDERWKELMEKLN